MNVFMYTDAMIIGSSLPLNTSQYCDCAHHFALKGANVSGCRPVIAGAARRDRGWGRGDGASNNKPPPGPPGVDPASEEEDWDDWGDWGDPKVLSDWVDEAQAARRNGKSRSQSSRRRGRCMSLPLSALEAGLLPSPASLTDSTEKGSPHACKVDWPGNWSKSLVPLILFCLLERRTQLADTPVREVCVSSSLRWDLAL